MTVKIFSIERHAEVEILFLIGQLFNADHLLPDIKQQHWDQLLGWFWSCGHRCPCKMGSNTFQAAASRLTKEIWVARTLQDYFPFWWMALSQQLWSFGLGAPVFCRYTTGATKAGPESNWACHSLNGRKMQLTFWYVIELGHAEHAGSVLVAHDDYSVEQLAKWLSYYHRFAEKCGLQLLIARTMDMGKK